MEAHFGLRWPVYTATCIQVSDHTLNNHIVNIFSPNNAKKKHKHFSFFIFWITVTRQSGNWECYLGCDVGQRFWQDFQILTSKITLFLILLC